MAVLKYKAKNGEYKTLTNISVKGIEPKQTTGTSTTDVMSQNAVTVELAGKATTGEVNSLSGVVTGLNATVTAHTASSEIHVTAEDKAAWGDVVNKVSTIDFNTYTAATSAAVSANTDAILTLNGDEHTSGSVKQIVVDEIAKVVADAPEQFDTLKEISDWISNNVSGAAYMQSEITTNQTNINTVSGTVTGHTGNSDIHVDAFEKARWNEVSAKTDNDTFTAHTASTVHLSETEKENLDSLETNIAAISGIDSTKVSAWDGAAASAHSHDNKVYLDGITGTVGTAAYKGVANGISSGSDNLAPSNVVFNYIGDRLGSGFTGANSGNTVTSVIEDNEFVFSTAINDFDERLTDNANDLTAHTASSVHMTSTEKTNLDSLATNIGAISGITSQKVSNWDNAASSNHTHTNKTYLDGITGNVGTAAYKGVANSVTSSDDNLTPSNVVFDYVGDKLGSGFTGANSAYTVTLAFKENEEVFAASLVDINERKLDASAYTEVTVTTSSTNGAISVNGSDVAVHGLDSMAYEDKDSYSSATEVNTELAKKLEATDVEDFFDDVKYETSGNSKVISFYNGATLKAAINADAFIKDGMISGVTLDSKSGTTYLVIDWNTDAGIETTELNIGDIFEADNYYTTAQTSGATEISTALAGKSDTGHSHAFSEITSTPTTLAGYGITDAISSVTTSNTNGNISVNGSDVAVAGLGTMAYEAANSYSSATQVATALGTGFTVSSVTDVIESNEMVVAAAINDLNTNKADKATTLAGYGITDASISNGTITLGSNSITPLTAVSVPVSSVTTSSTNGAISVNNADVAVHGLDSMAYEDKDSYSSATEVNTALTGKSDTGHSHAFSEITSTPTTLAGYGITDAKIENGVITLGSNTITPLTAVSVPVTSVTTSSTNGAISVNGSDVAVAGLGTMAYEAANSYSSATQVATALGTGFTVSSVTDVIESNERVVATAINDLNTNKADKATTLAGYGITDAISSVTTSSTNGNISVNGSDVAVAGLGGAAYLSTGTTAGTVAAGNHTHSSYAALSAPVFSSNTSSLSNGYTATTYTSSEPVVYCEFTFGKSLNNQICPVTLAEGQQCNVVYYNSGSSAYSVSVSTGSSYRTPENTAITPSVKAYGYCEINYLKVNGHIYVRGV